MAITGFTQTLTDDFNRADQNPIAGNWTTSTAAGEAAMWLLSSHVTYTNSAIDGACFWTSWTGGDDQYSEAEITASGTASGAGIGPCVRRSTTASINTQYRVVLDGGGNYELIRLTAGVAVSLRTGTVSYIAAARLGLSVTGSTPATLKIWYGGTQVGTDYVDSVAPISSGGNPGIGYSSAIPTFAEADNWAAGILVTTTPADLAYVYHDASRAFSF